LSGNGDAVSSQSGSASVAQSTFVDNTRAVVGASGVTLSVRRCTISGNGTGVLTGGAQTEVRASLLVGNTINLSGTATRAFNLLNVTAAQAKLETDGSGKPLLKDNGGPTPTVALLAGSSCINASDPGISQGDDQRGTGFSRVVGGRADIGAFEFQTPSASTNTRQAVPSGGAS
jgi:hypothetical protein